MAPVCKITWANSFLSRLSRRRTLKGALTLTMSGTELGGLFESVLAVRPYGPAIKKTAWRPRGFGKSVISLL